MGPTNNSVSISGFSIGLNTFSESQAQEEKETQETHGLDNDVDKVFYSVGGHLSVGDGTKRNALDRALIDSFQRVSELMLDYLPVMKITPVVVRATVLAQEIDQQEGLSTYLLREVIKKKIVPMAVTAGVGYVASKLVQRLMLDPLGLVKDTEMVGSGLHMATKWVLKKICGAVMPEDIHGSLVNDLTQSLISFVVENSLVPGEAIKIFSGKLMD